MVKDSLEQAVDIAITTPAEDSENDLMRFEGRLAGAGRPHILKQHEDGRMIILLVGKEKVRLGKITQQEPYLQCEATLITENSDLESVERFKLNRVHQQLVKWAGTHIEDSQTYEQFVESLTTPTVIVETAALIFLPERQQQQELLELNDINEKLARLLEILESERELESEALDENS